MAAFKDRTGDKYGRLTVISHVGKDHRKKHLWLCLCDCGNKKVVVADNLSSGKSNSCGCLKAEFLARKGNQYGLYEDREKALLKVQYSHLKRRNENKGFAEMISFDIFSRLSKSPCNYCGLEYSKEIEDRLSESKKQKRLSDYVLKCNGIDRVDSSKWYTVQNSVACCKYCNTAKSTMSVDEFLKWISRVYEFNNLGSTGVACVNTNRNFIGVELDENYFNIAEKRIQEALDNKEKNDEPLQKL